MRTRMDSDINDLGQKSNLAFAHILDDFTFTGRPGYAYANGYRASAVNVALFPHRKPPGYVNGVGKYC